MSFAKVEVASRKVSSSAKFFGLWSVESGIAKKTGKEYVTLVPPNATSSFTDGMSVEYAGSLHNKIADNVEHAIEFGELENVFASPTMQRQLKGIVDNHDDFALAYDYAKKLKASQATPAISIGGSKLSDKAALLKAELAKAELAKA
jgi:hypothetical protein